MPAARKQLPGLSVQSRQARRRDGLAVALLFLIRNVERDFICQLRKFYFQNFLRAGSDNFPSGSRYYPPKDQDIFQIIEIGKVRNGVTKIGPDGFVNPASPRIALLHKLLDMLQFFRQSKLRIDIDSRGREQSTNALLGEILDVAAVIAGPFVARSIGIVIDRRKGEFVDPGSDVALSVDVAAGCAGAKGDSQNAIFAE